MIIHPGTGIPVTSYHSLKKDSEWLKTFLKDQAITYDNKSVLGKAIYYSDNLFKWSSSPDSVPNGIKTKDVFSKVIGLSYLVRTIAEARKHPKFKQITRLLPNIAKENPIMTEEAESTQQRNFVFELEVASIFLATGISAESKSEPDVILKDDNSKKWNIACKMIYSDNDVTLGDRIEKGIEQVLKYESDYGLVVIGISNRLDHNSFMPILDEKEDILGSFTSENAVKTRFNSTIGSYFSKIQSQASTRFSDGKKTQTFRGIMLIAHTICGIWKASSLITGVALIQRHDIYGTPILYGPELELCTRFSNRSQSIFTG